LRGFAAGLAGRLGDEAGEGGSWRMGRQEATDEDYRKNAAAGTVQR
jgi:hypothetical protein